MIFYTLLKDCGSTEKSQVTATNDWVVVHYALKGGLLNLNCSDKVSCTCSQERLNK